MIEVSTTPNHPKDRPTVNIKSETRYWGIRLHPEDHSVRGGTWDAWTILDYGTDKNAAKWVRKGLATRQLMRKIGKDGEWAPTRG